MSAYTEAVGQEAGAEPIPFAVCEDCGREMEPTSTGRCNRCEQQRDEFEANNTETDDPRR